MPLHRQSCSLRADDGTDDALATISPFAERRGIMCKDTADATAKDRPDILKRRDEWLGGQLDPEGLTFIDEICALTNMARRYGRVPGGEWA